MSDLISREAAIEAITNYAKFLWGNFHEKCNSAGMIDAIEALPTIDLVKHGKWVDRRSIVAMNRYECSVCKRMTTVDEFMGKPMYAYCPWCGAELKGEE